MFYRLLKLSSSLCLLFGALGEGWNAYASDKVHREQEENFTVSASSNALPNRKGEEEVFEKRKRSYNTGKKYLERDRIETANAYFLIARITSPLKEENPNEVADKVSIFCTSNPPAWPEVSSCLLLMYAENRILRWGTNGHKEEEALEELLKRECVQAALYLTEFFYNSKGSASKDYSALLLKTYQWLADRGDLQAQYETAEMYKTGQGTQDFTIARYHDLTALEKYQNLKMAIKYYGLAAKKGYEKAVKAINKIEEALKDVEEKTLMLKYHYFAVHNGTKAVVDKIEKALEEESLKENDNMDM